MRIELTVIGPAARRDVAIESRGPVRLGEVLPALRAAVGAAEHDPVRGDGRMLTADAALGSPGLRTGSLLHLGGPPPTPPVATVLELDVVGGAVTDAPLPLRRGRVVVGRDPGCELVLDDDGASRRHAAFDTTPERVVVRDLGSTNGTTVAGRPVSDDGTPVGPGDVVRVGDSLLALAAPSGPAGGAGRRAPRAEVVIDLGPDGEGPRPGRVHWVTALLPALGGAAMAWLLGAPQLLLVALLSPVMVLSGALGDRLHWRRTRRRAARERERRRDAAGAALAHALQEETHARRAEAPDPAALGRAATTVGSWRWERRAPHPDQLVVRVGSADLPSRTRVRTGRDERPGGRLRSVPVTVDLREGPVGVVGPPDVVAGIVRWIVGQLAALHSPADLELVVPDHTVWHWCRWLPHVRPGPPRDPADAGRTVERRRRVAARPAPGPGRRLVIVTDADIGNRNGNGNDVVAGLPADAPQHGVTAVCLATERRALPAACRTVLVAGDGAGSRIAVETVGGESAGGRTEALADRVSASWADRLARALSAVPDSGTGSGADDLPDRVELADVIPATAPDTSVTTVLRGWATSDGGARVTLGIGRDGPVELDLVADGPHALVAGTTGSGKSELLRSLVIGLAATHPPTEVSFLLVDYKGGAAFGECARLPHACGLVTDLDPALTSRALRSLHAELRRREALFAAVGVDDLTGYRRRAPAGAAPVPRLVVVVDEFAELADDLPEFVSGLVGVARRGRSLGVHLVLATQRPGTAVTADIRANTGLRIALRVTDPADSGDVIGSPDAADLDPRHPGRAYVRTATTLRAVQTATVAHTPPPDPAIVEVLGPWRSPPAAPPQDDTAAAAVVDLLRRAAEAGGAAPATGPWLPPLPATIDLATLPDARDAVAIGLLDRPDVPAQPPLTVAVGRDAGLLVVGRQGSGRSTALAVTALAAAAGHGPDALHVHLVDGGGALAPRLAALPHLGTVVTPASAELVPPLLERLAAGPAPARSLLLIDDWDRVLGDRDDAEAAEWADRLAVLLRAGPGVGVTPLVSGGRALLLPRTAAAFGSRLVLDLADRSDYGLAGVAVRDLPRRFPPGAGVRADDAAQFQLAHPGPVGPDAVAAAARALARRHRAAAGAGALRLRPLPNRVSLADVRARVGDTAALVIGLVGHTAAPCALDLIATRARVLVAGPPRSGRSSVLLTLLAEATRLGLPVVVLAPARSPVPAAARRVGAAVLDPAGPAAAPGVPTLLLVDDDEVLDATPAAEAVLGWLRAPGAPLAAVVSGRSDDLATSYRGIAAEVRRERCGLLLRPGPVDGDLLGIRVPRRAGAPDPPGRGLLVGDPRWGPLFASGVPLPVQIAVADDPVRAA